MFSLIKYFLLGFVLLFLFHFESLNVGIIKVSHLWKGILVVVLLIKIFNQKNIFFSIYKPLFGLSILFLLNTEMLVNPFNGFLLFGMNLIMPLLGLYVLKMDPNQLQKALMFLSTFFVLSFIPYEIGILSSFKGGYNLESYGVTEMGGVIGPFQTVHSASTALAGSFIVLLYFWFKKVYKPIILLMLMGICFYFLIFTYVRTGMAMVLVGSIPILSHYSKKNIKTMIRFVFIGVTMSILISGWVLTNETLMDRITGKRASGSQETESFESLGSGRGKLFIASIEIFEENVLFEKFFGAGLSQSTERMHQKVGYRLLPHNGFLGLLLVNGLIGLFLFLLFIRNVVKKRKINNENKILFTSTLLAYLVMTFLQSYDMLYMFVIFAFSYGIFIKSGKSIKTINQVV